MNNQITVIIMTSIILFGIATGCSMQTEGFQPLCVTVSVDETVDSKLSFTGHLKGLIEDYDQHSTYFQDYLNAVPSGPVYNLVRNSKAEGKIFSQESQALVSDMTSDGLMMFMMQAVDFPNNIYAFEFRYVYQPDSSEGYTIELDHTAFFTHSLPAVKRGQTTGFCINGSYQATKTWGNLTKSGSWYTGDHTATVYISAIDFYYYVAVASNEDSPEVTTRFPVDESACISTTTPIRVNFDKDMDTSITDLYVNDVLVNGNWNSATELEFIPAVPLPAMTKIWVIVPEYHKSITGDDLPVFEEYWFETL